MTCVVITPNSPLIFRDPRPFDAGAGGAVSLPFPTPSAVAGTLRTAIVRNANNDDFPHNKADEVVNWKFRGPLLRVGDHVCVPAPADAYPVGGQFHRLRPMTGLNGAGFNTPGGLAPVGLNSVLGKPDRDAPAFWKLTALAEQWLVNAKAPVNQSDVSGFSLERDRRTHVAIGENYAGVPGVLFSTDALDFQGKEGTAQLVVKVLSAGDAPYVATNLNGYTHRIGGEGRFADFSVDNDAWQNAPETWKASVRGASQLRMVLVTPAVYRDGWKPEWLGTDFTGTIPETQTRVKLVGARIPRWKPLAGWEMKRAANGTGKEGGPKPMRRMTPAGSVYFFEKVGNTEVNPDELWLKSSMSDNDAPEANGLANLKNDGFGLAVWGAW